MKTNRFDNINTIQELVESLFPYEMDGIVKSNKPKREASYEWLVWYINGRNGKTPQYKYNDINEFSFGLWAKWHDDKDNFFKDRRDDLIELVNKWASII